MAESRERERERARDVWGRGEWLQSKFGEGASVEDQCTVSVCAAWVTCLNFKVLVFWIHTFHAHSILFGSACR